MSGITRKCTFAHVCVHTHTQQRNYMLLVHSASSGNLCLNYNKHSNSSNGHEPGWFLWIHLPNVYVPVNLQCSTKLTVPPSYKRNCSKSDKKLTVEDQTCELVVKEVYIVPLNASFHGVNITF